MSARVILAASAVVFVTVASLSAEAAPKPEDVFEAQRLFTEALADMKSGKLEEACPKLERSQKLDPAMGTQFRLGECYEKSGKIVSAAALYQEVVDAAKAANRPDRMIQAQKAVEALLPRVPGLIVHVDAATAALPGLEVTRDGAPVDPKSFGQRTSVDPGEHKIAARAPGYRPAEQTVKVAEKETSNVTVPALEKDPTDAPVPDAQVPAKTLPALPTEPSEESSNAVPIGFTIALGAAGLAGIGVGAGLGLMASASWSDAEDNCLEGSPRICNSTGVEAASDAASSATISTIGFVAGGVLLASAVVPLVFAISGDDSPPPKVAVLPVFGLGVFGVQAGAAF